MNYEGIVSSVNATLWTFEVDSKITVHMGHMAAHNPQQMLPEISEKVQLYNAHYKASRMYQLEKLFLCEKSRIVCDSYKTYAREVDILHIIQEYNLGVSDLLEIDYNIGIVDEFIRTLVQLSTELIILEVTRCIAQINSYKANQCNQEHKCLNKNIPTFTLTTVSHCRYIDSESTDECKGPPWSFGTHSKTLDTDILLGHLQINKRYGVICIYDAKHTMPCLITARNKTLNKSIILNKIVLVKEYRIFTESYREAEVPNLEYILFDVEDVIVLDLQPLHLHGQEVFVKELPADFPYVYDFKFNLCRKASVSVVNGSNIECWLEVLITKNCQRYFAYLCLNAYHVQILPFLQEGESYHVYHQEKLIDLKVCELSRLKSHPASYKFAEKTAIFVHDVVMDYENEAVNPILNVAQTLTKIRESDACISFQGILKVKKFTPKLSSRTRRNGKCVGFGTPGSRTHTLTFVDDAGCNSLSMYLNNWENLQIPLGLVIDMRICVRNALPQKNKYLKSCAMTTFEVLGYEPLVLFDTVNLSSDPARGCDKYTFLGLGDLIPSSVLIWTRLVQLYLRSLKIFCNCDSCSEKSTDCTCGDPQHTLGTTITLYVYDEMGQAMVISKSIELLRLLLGLEVKQWKIWCLAFKSIGEYVHDFEQKAMFSHESDKNVFSEALAVSVKVLNAMKVSNLDLMCRKMDSSVEDNEGMPKWFCVDARERKEDLFLGYVNGFWFIT